MRVEQKKITPKMAGEMLKGNTRNRAIYSVHVDRLAAAILNNEWKLNGDAIRFNGDQLIDGQHRLHAIIKAGKPITTLVITDLNEDVFDTIDVGKVRTTANTLQAAGEKNSCQVAAGLRALKGIMMGAPDSIGRVSNTEIMAGLAQHPDIRRSAAYIHNKKTASILVRGGNMCALHYLFSKKDETLADLFFSSLDDGSGLMMHDPIYWLRQRLLQNRLSPAKISTGHIAALTIKAWNSVRKSERVKQLRFTPSESFPKIH